MPYTKRIYVSPANLAEWCRLGLISLSYENAESIRDVQVGTQTEEGIPLLAIFDTKEVEIKVFEEIEP